MAKHRTAPFLVVLCAVSLQLLANAAGSIVQKSPLIAVAGGPLVSKQQRGLAGTFDSNGLHTLAYNGISLLDANAGEPGKSLHASLTLQNGESPTRSGSDTPTTQGFDKSTGKLTQTYSWGVLTCRYVLHGERLQWQVRVVNTSKSDTITRLELRLSELTFPVAPRGTVLDAGMFGTGGQMHPIGEYPLSAPAEAMPPVLFVDYGNAMLAYCSDDVTAPATIGIPYTTNRPASTAYPLQATFDAIQPGASVTANFSLRFGASGTAPASLASDLIRRYRAAYPFQVTWKDRRAIGAIFLSSVGKHVPGNLRGWFNNVYDVDVTTEAGLAAFRARLLRYADESIRTLKGMNAQGMITWDPEGQQHDRVTYYGDPSLAAQLAPETHYRGGAQQACLDEYFQRFREAGLRVGVCVRPQQIRFVNGIPQQEDSPDPEATLKAKIAYARQRWGCTLFYIDSTVRNDKPLPASIFKHLADAFPGVLLIPENETLRDYAYTAPLNSFQDHSVASTPPGAQTVYPQAFSVLLAMDGDNERYHAALVAAVRRGDILVFRGWYDDLHNPAVRRIYEEARARP